jgi:hypothetical protein
LVLLPVIANTPLKYGDPKLFSSTKRYEVNGKQPASHKIRRKKSELG